MNALASRWATVVLLAAAELAGAQAPATRQHDPQSIDLPFTKWDNPPKWQPMPKGKGELLPFPSYYPIRAGIGPVQERPRLVSTKDRSYVATELGLLESADAQRSWRLVDKLAGRSFNLIDVGQWVWVEEGAVHKLAFDPKDWTLKAQFDAPGFGIAAGDEGVWVLTEPPIDLKPDGILQPVTQPARRGMEHAMDRIVQRRPHATVLTLFDSVGKQVWRLRSHGDGAGLGPPKPDEVTIQNSGDLQNVMVDDKHIWLIFVEVKGEMPNDAPIYGRRELVRIERATRKIDVRPMALPSMMALSGNKGFAIGGGGYSQKYGIFEWPLDGGASRKFADIAMSRHYVERLTADDRHLWVYCGDGPRVFRLSDFKEMSVADALPAPNRGNPLGAYAPFGGAGLHAFASDDQRLWLVGGGRLIETRDDGSTISRDVSRWIGSVSEWQNATSPGVLYAWWNGLTRIDVDSPKSRRIEVASSNLLPRRFVTPQWIWAQTHAFNGLTAVRSDLSESRFISIKLPDYDKPWYNANFAALGDRLFCLIEGMAGLYTLTADEPKPRRIDSWKQAAAELAENAMVPVGSVLHPAWITALPGNRIAVAYVHGIGVRNKTTVLVYDPSQDTWQTVKLDDAVWTTVAGPAGSTYAIGTQTIYRWTGKSFDRFADHPLPVRPGTYQESIYATTRYLYIQTTAGVYRIEWAQLK